MSGIARHHQEWLGLVEVSGPFLTLPALVRAFPQGLPKPATKKLGRLRAAYEEWADAQEGAEPDAPTLHATWIRLVLGELLEFDEKTIRSGDRIASNLEASLAEHHETLRPSMAIVEPTGRTKAGSPRLLIATWPLAQDLEAAVSDARWAASPLERMTQLCHSTGVRLGLVTNGERWTVVDAPVGQTAGYASWYAGLWLQEPITLAAFEALLGVRRFFQVAEGDTLEALLDESVAFQQELTDQLGYQVRRAVEVLVQALDRADFDRGRELLKDVSPQRLYEASLTVMMRLVFLFCAEERGLLLLGDETYDANYAVSTLRAQLREEADRVGVEVLERRQDAWARLLATFRAVYGGIEHEVLRMPALGGSLFDPDRFPFLEGRALETSWLDTPASPLPIDNRTVLHLLDALQLLRMKGDAGSSEARNLSYRALDIEQIGHVYEGLLDHVAVRVTADTLGLTGAKDKEPEITIDDLERERRQGKDALVEFLKGQTGRSVSALRNGLDAELGEEAEQRLLVACGNDRSLLKRVEPYHALVREDQWGYPQVYRAGSFMVTGGTERRQTGTHYTPKALTEQIVAETLEPLAYIGPSDGKPRAEWTLRPSAELLDLKICDMAMGSAAFLVQVCRWLGERIVEAWEDAERVGASVSVDGDVLDKASGEDRLPNDREERRGLAKRLVAERCVYGVDINPLAVELAKLSLWLVTLAKGRPFGFLDHNLRSGDSLLGIASLAQLENFHLDPARGKRLHHALFDPRHEIQGAVAKALECRRRLRAIRILDIEDVRAMAGLDEEAKAVLRPAELAAHMLVGAAIANAGARDEALDEKLVDLTDGLKRAIAGGAETKRFEIHTRELLDTDCPERLRPRHPFHWAIEFPEVFAREGPGFDAIVGNPPFMGGRLIGRRLGNAYQEYLKFVRNFIVGSPDLCAYFFLRAFALVRNRGHVSLLATKSIAETGSRVVCLDQIISKGGKVNRAYSRFPWPGRAAVDVSIVWIAKNSWGGPVVLDDRHVSSINGALEEDLEIQRPRKLKALKGKYSQGQDTMGRGFELTAEERRAILAEDPACEEVIFPYFNGQDLNTMSTLKPYRWVIYFRNWPENRARKYPPAFRRVERLVRPYRESLTGQIHQDCYWKFWDLRPKLVKELGCRDQILASAKTSKYLSFRYVSTRNVMNNQTKLYFIDSLGEFACLQSSIHIAWAYWCCGMMGLSRIKYSTSEALETWPMPEHATCDALERAGQAYHSLREALLAARQVGLTQLYNQFHNASNRDGDIEELRGLQCEMDLAVARAYGWSDVALAHGFHEVPYLPETDNVRFTIAEPARIEALRRLAVLNRIRYEEEVREGLHGPADAGLVDLHSARRRRARGGRSSIQESEVSYAQGDLVFEGPLRRVAEPRATYDSANGAAHQIREWLAAHRGWHAKEEILAGARVDPDEWLPAIRELVESGAVAKQGERRGTKYTAK